MKKGFTLIELLIVITIIGILAVAFLPSLLGAPSRARDTQRVADVQKIAGVLTTKLVAGSALMPSSGCVNATTLTTLKAEDFGGKLPVDPNSSDVKIDGFPTTACDGEYLYIKNPEGSNKYSFGVYAQLENATGNFNCASTTQDVLATNADQSCYAILVQ